VRFVPWGNAVIGPIAAIQSAVASHYGLSEQQLLVHCRARRLARPRQIGMWLSRRLTHKSLAAIGYRFGRDHTTVIHAVETIDDLVSRGDDWGSDALLLEERLRGSPSRNLVMETGR
jgi:chromosomal replication initiator protein